MRRPAIRKSPKASRAPGSDSSNSERIGDPGFHSPARTKGSAIRLDHRQQTSHQPRKRASQPPGAEDDRDRDRQIGQQHEQVECGPALAGRFDKLAAPGRRTRDQDGLQTKRE